ncbi:MAG TPA: glycoside hydrolase family 3 N-terminal domain-containing protein [Candidatus Hydrogenedens sp.]|nr:glycoside hydrolase family 3 N-terminal domain-containing protein [Candidatus Hydrogenedens sp.]
MEVSDLNVKVYKRQSPFSMVVIFVLGIVIGFALFYIYSQLNSPPPKETSIQPQIVQQKKPTEAEEPPQKEPPQFEPKDTDEQKLVAELENIAPIIYLVDENKFNDDVLILIQQIHPFAVAIRHSGENANRDSFVGLLQNIRNTIQQGSCDLPLFAMELDLNYLSSLTEFQGLAKISDFNINTDISKIVDAGTSYAKKARELGISMFLGPMIELYVPGRVPETEKSRYFGDTTESIQKIGLSFAQGIWQGKVITVIKSFPSKSLALKKEVDNKISFALEVDNPAGDMNQAISQLATWLFPFSEAVHQGLPALLVSHVAIPLLDSENPYLPASVSQKVIQGLIREKWNYQGIIIADDISEYPLNSSETYTDVALRMIGVGIDLICTSLEDINELSKMVNVIEQNISKEAKDERCMKLAKLVMAVRPLSVKKEETIPFSEPIPTTEPTTAPIPSKTTLIAQEPVPTPSETVSEPPKEEIPPSVNIEQSIPPTAEQSTTTLKTSELSETKVAQDLSHIVTETKPIPEEQTTTTEVPKEASTIGKTTEGAESTINKEKEEKSEIEEPIEEKPLTESDEVKKEEVTKVSEKSSEKVENTKSIVKVPQPPGTKAICHQIARGETLYAIAQKYNVKPKDIMAWNGIDNPNLIKYGFKLLVYVPEGVEINSKEKRSSVPAEQQKPATGKESEIAPIAIPETELQTEKNNAQSQPVIEPIKEKPKTDETTPDKTQEKLAIPSGEIIIYIVKHGDTLDSIAKDTRVSKEEIIQLNNLKKPYILPAGRKLKVPRIPKVRFNN